MMRVPNVKVVQDPIVLHEPEHGKIWATERTHVTINRWRQTPFGRVNFGWTWMSSPRFVEIKK